MGRQAGRRSAERSLAEASKTAVLMDSTPDESKVRTMEKRIGVLFVSRRNSLRSVLAESCLMHLGGKKFRVFSCGQPGHIALGVHPAASGALAMAMAMAMARAMASIPITFDTPRDWNALVRSGAPMVDFVITLDAELAHDLPRWPGQPDLAVWEYPDVASLRSSEDAAVTAIRTLYSLHRRLEFLIALPLKSRDRAAVRSDLRDLAHLQ